jgi:hypothetical protein
VRSARAERTGCGFGTRIVTPWYSAERAASMAV